jgi:hypothetical protein
VSALLSRNHTAVYLILKRISQPQLQSLGLHEVKQHKPWFDEECSGFLDQRKQAKM